MAMLLVGVPGVALVGRPTSLMASRPRYCTRVAVTFTSVSRLGSPSKGWSVPRVPWAETVDNEKLNSDTITSSLCDTHVSVGSGSELDLVHVTRSLDGPPHTSWGCLRISPGEIDNRRQESMVLLLSERARGMPRRLAAGGETPYCHACVLVPSGLLPSSSRAPPRPPQHSPANPAR